MKSSIKPFYLSPSGIAVFKQCRQRYKFLHIDKLGDKYGKPRPYFTMANHVHATLKEFLSLQPIGLRNAATAEELLRKNWQRYRLGFRDTDDEKRWAEKALAQLSAFVNIQDVGAQPIMMEEMIEAEISTGLVLRGRIDRVDKEPDGTLHIIDYKTGNTAGEIDWEQLELHALILSKRLPWPVSKISYLYLGNSAMKSTVISGDDLRQVLWRVLTTANIIRQEKQFYPNPSPWCGNCDFISICPGKSEAESLATSSDQPGLWDDS
ncbi:MAG: PD-(D/E)XK nuclease family protein [Dehalococcoidales bacterium]|nr:PD-(D/E)XK nuclease family protein [Dehalococcoidales bacterium]